MWNQLSQLHLPGYGVRLAHTAQFVKHSPLTELQCRTDYAPSESWIGRNFDPSLTLGTPYLWTLTRVPVSGVVALFDTYTCNFRVFLLFNVSYPIFWGEEDKLFSLSPTLATAVMVKSVTRLLLLSLYLDLPRTREWRGYWNRVILVGQNQHPRCGVPGIREVSQWRCARNQGRGGRRQTLYHVLIRWVDYLHHFPFFEFFIYPGNSHSSHTFSTRTPREKGSRCSTGIVLSSSAVAVVHHW